MSDELTKERLAELRRMLAAATPGKWYWATSNSRKRINSTHECWTRDGAVLDAFRASDGVPCVSVRDEDMAVIVEAHNSLGELLDLASDGLLWRRLRKLLDEMDPRASYRIPAFDAISAVLGEEEAVEREREERGT